MIESPTYGGEVEQVIAKMNNNRAPGEENLVIELFKYRGKSLENKLHRLICHIWEEEVMLEDWNMAFLYVAFLYCLIIPVFKSGEKTKCRHCLLYTSRCV